VEPVGHVPVYRLVDKLRPAVPGPSQHRAEAGRPMVRHAGLGRVA
jgi:hypothetical protein